MHDNESQRRYISIEHFDIGYHLWMLMVFLIWSDIILTTSRQTRNAFIRDPNNNRELFNAEWLWQLFINVNALKYTFMFWWKFKPFPSANCFLRKCKYVIFYVHVIELFHPTWYETDQPIHKIAFYFSILYIIKMVLK